MKRFLSVVLIGIFMAGIIHASDKTKVNLKGTNSVKRSKLVINSDRAVVLKGVIKTSNADAIITSLKKFNESAPDNIFIIIDSPGGSVVDGYNLINTIRSLRAKVICAVEADAYSMAAIISQYCSETYLLKYSSMMFHEASYYVSGKASDINIMVDFTNKYLRALDIDLAKQMGITFDEYQTRIAQEWWVTAEEAIKFGLADGLLDTLYYTALPPKQDNPFFILGGQGGNIVNNPLRY